MADEQQQEQVKEEKQYTSDEEKAMSNGWTPKDEWDGNPEDWIPARQFNRNGELFGRINSYKHKIQSLEQSVKSLAAHNERVYEAGYNDAIAKLKAERRVALREGDAEAVEAIEERIEEVETKKKEQLQEIKAVVAPATQEMHPAFDPWVEKNQWYANDSKLRGAADALAREIVQSKNGKIDFPDLLAEVEKQMREEFPEKTGGKKVTKQMSSDRGDGQSGARGTSRTKGRNDLSDVEAELSDDERNIMETLVSSGVLTKEKYLQDIQKVNNKGRR